MSVWKCENHACRHKSNKNAFQWDAYRPLFDRIPACTVQGVSAQGGVCLGGCLPGGCLPMGVSAQGEGVSTQGGVCLGGCLPRGCLAGGSARGVSASGPRGVYPSMQWVRHPPVDRQTPVKT